MQQQIKEEKSTAMAAEFLIRCANDHRFAKLVDENPHKALAEFRPALFAKLDKKKVNAILDSFKKEMTAAMEPAAAAAIAPLGLIVVLVTSSRFMRLAAASHLMCGMLVEEMAIPE